MQIPINDNNTQNISAEFNILGAIIASNELLEHIPFLQVEHFVSEPHQRIFLSIKRLIASGQRADIFSLGSMLDGDEDLSLAGGTKKYLVSSLGQGGIEPFPIEIAKLIVRLAQRRALLGACSKAEAVIQENLTEDPAEIALTLAKEFEEVSRGFDSPQMFDDFQVTEQILESLKEEKKPYSTGIARLDECMDGGLYPGKAYGFAAKKKVGKTILASTISCNLNALKVKHLFICGEMSPQEIHQRNLARLTDSFPSAFRTSYGQSPQFHMKVAEAALKSNRCILYYNAPGLTFDELRRVCLSSILQRRVKGIILDYWQLVGGKPKNKSTSEHLDEVAQWIADTCRKYGVWSVVMAQINQEGNTRGGEGIRLAFDQVYHLKAPDEDNSNPERHLEMLDTRYTAWKSLGGNGLQGLMMNEKGPYFE
jgi:replicative DNA helicase